MIRGNSYALFAAPHITSINELKTDQRPLAKQLFIGFWRILQYTQSVFSTFADQNPVSHMNLEYLNFIELTPPDYVNAREEFVFGNNPDADGTYARPNPADVAIRRPAAPPTPKRPNQPPPRIGQAGVPINPPINVGPLPSDFMNLASLQQAIARIQQQADQNANVSQETIDNLENVLNETCVATTCANTTSHL